MKKEKSPSIPIQVLKMKICNVCHKEKSIDSFHKGKGYKNGIRPYCKDCRKKEKLNYRLKNKKKILITNHEYYLKNKETILNKLKIYRLIHKEKRKETVKRSDLKCKDRIEKYKNQPHVKIAHRLRNRIRLVLIGTSKSDSTLNLLGCSFKFLKKHLESQFKEGMSWENYGIGGWEIDHIKPCASFNLKNPKEQKKCFHYSNLQPLWFNKNRAKNAHKIGY
jgi:hypothetical protein